MKNYLYCLLVILIFADFSFAQWHWQNPVPFGERLTDIQFLNNNTGYACGDGGTVLKTIDGGNEWSELKTDSISLIQNIFFLNSNVGWYLTYFDNKIYRTIDGGESWFFIGNLDPWYGSNLWFINESKGFAAGYPGGLLKTTDGGENWSIDNSVFGSSAIYFVNENFGVTGGQGNIYKTSDGGDSWTQTNAAFLPYHYVDKIYAISNNHIYYIAFGEGPSGEIVNWLGISSDGGNSWTNKFFDYTLFDVYFKTSNEGWVCSDKIYYTSDRGASWEKLNTSAMEFDFVDNNSWGINYNIIVHSSDNWNTSEKQIKSVTSETLWNGCVKDSNIVFACGSHENIIGTIDGGNTWTRYFKADTSIDLWAITFKRNEIWSVGSGGLILNSSDLGTSWNKKYVDASGLYDIKFIDNNLGFAAGTKWGTAELFVTRDEGNIWKLLDTFSDVSGIYKIKFSTHGLGWMVGDEYRLFRTKNYGNTWEVVCDSIHMFKDIAVSGDTAWFSYYNKVLKTSDAGRSWESYKIFDWNNNVFWGSDIDFINAHSGYACLLDGRIFKTSDGGVSWSSDNSPTVEPLESIDFINEKVGWTFGDLGTILKRDKNLSYGEDNSPKIPTDFYLLQNYPNPFNPVTSIKFRIANLGFVSLKVYDILGREVVTLVNEVKKPGTYEIKFDGSNLPSGIYFYRIQAGKFIQTKKMILLK